MPDLPISYFPNCRAPAPVRRTCKTLRRAGIDSGFVPNVIRAFAWREPRFGNCGRTAMTSLAPSEGRRRLIESGRSGRVSGQRLSVLYDLAWLRGARGCLETGGWRAHHARLPPPVLTPARWPCSITP